MEKEIWKPVVGYEGLYEVSNHGIFRSIYNGRHKIFRIKYLKPGLNKGYHSLRLYLNGKGKTHEIHRLVARTFIENIFGYPCVNHINGIKTDNRVENLEWCSYSMNCKHAYDIGLRVGPWTGKSGKNNHLSKPILQYSADGTLINKFESATFAGNILNLNNKTISRCCNGEIKTAYGYIWSFQK